jgi:hypothetical protein
MPLPGLELRPLGRPAHSQSLCRLCYPGAEGTVSNMNNIFESIKKYSSILNIVGTSVKIFLNKLIVIHLSILLLQ